MRMWIKITFAIVFSIFCFKHGVKIPFDVHIKIYDTLLTASGILFGVFGLWVSILYPDILTKSLDEKNTNENPSDISAKANQLLQPMFFSLLLFLIMIFVEFLAPFIRVLDISPYARLVIKGISASVASLIFVALVISIFQAIDQTELFQAIVTKNAILSDMKKRFISGSRRKNK